MRRALGSGGPETAFANREAFVADIRDGGIAAMELVARDLKSLGLYTARALSFAGVEYEILEHCLSEDQIAVYDAYAEAWAIIHANLREALEATRIVDSETGGTLNSGAKSAALSIFEGTKQRFFAQLLLSMKLPSLLPAIDASDCRRERRRRPAGLDRRSHAQSSACGPVGRGTRSAGDRSVPAGIRVMLSSTLHVFFAVAVYVERGGGRRRFPSVFHDFTPDIMRVRESVRRRVRPAFERQ
jgi:hypothetical protein